MDNPNDKTCPKCGRNSIVGIHAGSTCGRRVLLHNYKCFRCGYDTDNFVSDDDAQRKLESDRANSRRNKNDKD